MVGSGVGVAVGATVGDGVGVTVATTVGDGVAMSGATVGDGVGVTTGTTLGDGAGIADSTPAIVGSSAGRSQPAVNAAAASSSIVTMEVRSVVIDIVAPSSGAVRALLCIRRNYVIGFHHR